MRFKSIVCIAVPVCICFSSCVFLPNSENSADESNTSNHISDVIIDESDTEISDEVSEEVSENPMASMSAKELIKYAEERSEQTSSYVQDVEQSYVLDDGKGNVSTQSVSYRSKGSAIGTEDAMMSYSFTSSDRNGNFYYKNGKGYSNSNNVRLSFDCTETQFKEYVELVVFQAYSEDNSDEFQDYIYENCTVTTKYDGSYELSYSGTVPYDMFAEYMGSDGKFIKQDKDIICNYTVSVTSEGFLVSEDFSFDFVMESSGQEFNVTIHSVSAVSNINENVSVIILDTGYTHVGSIDVMHAALSHEYVKSQEYYKGEAVRKYKVNGYGFNDDVTFDIEMNYDGIDLNKYAMSYDLIYNGTAYKYRYYFEDGKIYYKILDYDVNSVEYNLLPKLVYDEWVCYDMDLSYGSDFVYADNGDGTATLTYSLNDVMITEFADIYVYLVYGEEYYGMFAYADSVDVKEAKVTVVIDTETHCFISHSVKIDAKFVIEGENVTFKEESTQTFSPDGVVIPNRSAFLGTSSF